MPDVPVAITFATIGMIVSSLVWHLFYRRARKLDALMWKRASIHWDIERAMAENDVNTVKLLLVQHDDVTREIRKYKKERR